MFTQNRQLGSEGPDILALQQFLNTHGYAVASAGPGSSGQESTFFGPATRASLIKFQTANKLPASGYFGPLTRTLIVQMQS